MDKTERLHKLLKKTIDLMDDVQFDDFKNTVNKYGYEKY